MNTVIFRRDLPFVYGLTNSSQKPERQKYTDTIREFERRAPNHYRDRREKYSRRTRTDLKKTAFCTRDKENRAENRGRHREESLPPRAGPSSIRIRRETQAPE
ncbi:hypothetical protein [Marinobacter sp. F3R08]|uniref:hypothetical protein n=1 Tax=Marinobacter sp. F3R08 TaxID=2841559 RepID=UPI001C0978E6|nr:hypothetical protein [Marinobacter sp. F3R08]MBU2955341.1 hypothetical protein [Marinobacter sp. F3R08]